MGALRRATLNRALHWALTSKGRHKQRGPSIKDALLLPSPSHLYAQQGLSLPLPAYALPLPACARPLPAYSQQVLSVPLPASLYNKECDAHSWPDSLVAGIGGKAVAG
eukprot:1147787-Pelagomonas_calceolata.AAC.4